MIGSYLCVWHWAQPTVRPSHTAPVVFVRSTVRSTRNCSASVPPSSLNDVFRWNPVATFWSAVAPGRRSPASCWVVNWSNGRSLFNARITQSRYGQMLRGPSIV